MMDTGWWEGARRVRYMVTRAHFYFLFTWSSRRLIWTGFRQLGHICRNLEFLVLLLEFWRFCLSLEVFRWLFEFSHELWIIFFTNLENDGEVSMIVFRRLKNLFSDHTCLQLPPSGFMNYHSFDKPPDDNQQHYGITPMNPKAFKKLIKQFQLGDSELPKRYII